MASIEGTGKNEHSREYIDALNKSIFSFCPSGSGANSIRLWESIAAGAIPVILADTYAPPGELQLWKAAAVFCHESAAEVSKLPERLAEIAADPTKLASMRHAMHQLNILYGRDAFISDIQEFMLDVDLENEPSTTNLLEKLVRSPLTDGEIRQEAELLLTVCASELLLDPQKTLARLDGTHEVSKAVVKAKAALQQNRELSSHLEEVLTLADVSTEPVLFPRIFKRAAPKVCLFGRHSHRTPLSYVGFRREIGDRLDWTNDPSNAEFHITFLPL